MEAPMDHDDFMSHGDSMDHDDSMSHGDSMSHDDSMSHATPLATACAMATPEAPMSHDFQGRGLRIGGILFLSPQEAFRCLEEDAVLVDLRQGLTRNGRAFGVKHVIAIPHRELPDSIALLPRDRPLVLADCVGLRSKEAARLLQEAGFCAVASLNGGMVDWERDGLPVTLDPGEELSGACACQLKPSRTSLPRRGC